MKHILAALILVLAGCQTVVETEQAEEPVVAANEQPEWRLVIHGGSGIILRENMTA